MADLIWTPDPGTFPTSREEALIVSQENETHISAVITVEASEGQQPPKTLIWSMPDGAPDHMRVHSTANTITIDIDDWIGLFPIEIEYMEDADPVQVPGLVTKWSELPAEQADVNAFRPDKRNIRHFRFVVEAYSASNVLLETATYTITVYANYDIGRDALKSAVQQRKNAT